LPSWRFWGLGCLQTRLPRPPGITAYTSTVTASVYASNDGVGGDKGNWCVDSGTNKFVTNDEYDFIPGSVNLTETIVSVGSGTCVSPMTGDVLVRSTDTDVLVKFTNVLLLPDCEAKLMPVSPFDHKGCTLTIANGQVQLNEASGDLLFGGSGFGALYFFRAQTVRVHEQHEQQLQDSEEERTDGPDTSSGGLASYFGLPAGGLKIGALDFPRRLLEAHWAYGHLNFSKLRKLLGLKKGDDPDCASCTIALSRQRALAKTKTVRSTRVNHRLHLDLGFTKDCTFCFQLCVDDWSREGFLLMLSSKSDAFDSFIELQRQRDNEDAPWRLAVVKTDSEPLYIHVETLCRGMQIAGVST
jgi:hypothetical protein